MRFLCSLLVASIVNSALIPQTLEPRQPKEVESPLRRGEVIFFISYPFTFLASLVAFNLGGTLIYAIDGRESFSGTGGGFYAAVATTAAFLSFGIAINDNHAVKAQTKISESGQTDYLSYQYRF